MTGSYDRETCPLCGAKNECGIKAGRGTCWCFTQRVPDELLERLPDPARGNACICARCIESYRALPEPLRQLQRILRRRT